MVLSPSKDSKNSRSIFKAERECQENLGNGLMIKLDPKEVCDSVLQSSDFPNRQRSARITTKSAAGFPEFSRCNSPEPGDLQEQPQHASFPETGDKLVAGKSFLMENASDQDEGKSHKIDITDSAEIPLDDDQSHDQQQQQKQQREVVAAAAGGDQSRSSSAVEEISLVKEGDDLTDVEMTKASSAAAAAAAAAAVGKDSSGEWSDALNRNSSRRKERIVPVETLRSDSQDFDDGEEAADLAPLPFSGPIVPVPYSGPLFSSGGSISRRSDGSSASTRSFAFPVLPFEWNASPARMPPPERGWRRRRNWCVSFFCCSKPSTNP